MEQPRIVTWRAVSTADQVDKESLDYQHRLNMEHVARWNGVVVGQLEIPGETRNIILWEEACVTHEAFGELRRMLTTKPVPFDILMCQDITRLARRASLASTIAALCEQAGVRIYETTSPPASLDGPIATPDSRLLMLFKSHQSEQEVRKFAERTSFGRQGQARKGKHANHPPLGLKRTYHLDGDKVETITVIDEEWSPLVELFFELYVNQGRSQYQVCKEFNARGYTTVNGQPWDSKNIRLFLKNRWAYAGYVVWGQWSKTPEKAYRVKAEWPAIISEEMVLATERGMKERAGKPRSAGRPWLLSMMLRCNKCGTTVTSCSRAGHGRALSNSYNCRHRCPQSFIREPVIVEKLEEAIAYLQDQAQFDALVGETPPEHTTMAELLEESKKALDAVSKERKRLTQAYMREAIDIEEYESLMAEKKEEYNAIAHTVTDLETQLADIPTADYRRKSLLEIRDKGLEMLHHPDITTANAWLRRHFLVYVANHKVVNIHLY